MESMNSARYLRPIAETLLPEVVGTGDAQEHFAFTIRYKLGEDVSLSEHRDASVATINLCLGKEGFQGGRLYFVPNASEPLARHSFEHAPGSAIIHRGALRHGAEALGPPFPHLINLRLVVGERMNLIVWLFGKHGVVYALVVRESVIRMCDLPNTLQRSGCSRASVGIMNSEGKMPQIVNI